MLAPRVPEEIRRGEIRDLFLLTISTDVAEVATAYHVVREQAIGHAGTLALAILAS